MADGRFEGTCNSNKVKHLVQKITITQIFVSLRVLTNPTISAYLGIFYYNILSVYRYTSWVKSHRTPFSIRKKRGNAFLNTPASNEWKGSYCPWSKMAAVILIQPKRPITRLGTYCKCHFPFCFLNEKVSYDFAFNRISFTKPEVLFQWSVKCTKKCIHICVYFKNDVILLKF